MLTTYCCTCDKYIFYTCFTIKASNNRKKIVLKACLPTLIFCHAEFKLPEAGYAPPSSSSYSYSHPVPPAAPLLLLAGFLSHPVSAPVGPRSHSPAPGRRAIHTNTPTPPGKHTTNTDIYTLIRRHIKRHKTGIERISKWTDEKTDVAPTTTLIFDVL